MTNVHLIHIGKTGGTALKDAFQDHLRTASYEIVLHRHDVTLPDIPVGDRFMFFLRDPVSRFVSAFHSRRRQGRPRYDSRWTWRERRAFKRFESPEALALALGRKERAAVRAMRDIGHIKSSYWDWFVDEAYFRSRRPDLFFVGNQETMDEDFARLKEKLGLPAEVALPDDDERAHRNPPHLDLSLSEEARAVIRRWYERDYAFLELCRELAPRALA